MNGMKVIIQSPQQHFGFRSTCLCLYTYIHLERDIFIVTTSVRGVVRLTGLVSLWNYNLFYEREEEEQQHCVAWMAGRQAGSQSWYGWRFVSHRMPQTFNLSVWFLCFLHFALLYFTLNSNESNQRT